MIVMSSYYYSCFLSHVETFWVAFLAPILAIMVFNVVIFICIIVVLIRHTKNEAARMKKTVSNKTTIRLMVNVGLIMLLFGLTWLFGIFTFSVTGLREAFETLFVVFNSLQGLFIFLFVCLNKEVLESWREFLSCGKYRSEILHPASRAYLKITAQKQINSTGSTGLSSSSEGKYVSETPMAGYDLNTLTIKEYESDIGVIKVPLESGADLEMTKPEKVLTETATCAEDAVTTESTTGTPHQIQNGSTTDSGEKDNVKVRIKRYSTTNLFKHHVEEVEVDFYSDNSGSSDEEEVTDEM